MMAMDVRREAVRLATISLFMLVAGCASSHPAAAVARISNVRPAIPVSPQPGTPHDNDSSGEYIEYRYLPELGKITIADGAVRGDQSLAYLKNHTTELVARGIFPCPQEHRQIYRRTEKASGHVIDLLVILDPPSGGANNDDDDDDGTSDSTDGTQRLLVKIDGRWKIDCTIGSTADGSMWVAQVSLFPEDGTFHIVAISDDGEELTLPDAWERFDNPILITDQSFFEDEPGMENQPVKI